MCSGIPSRDGPKLTVKYIKIRNLTKNFQDKIIKTPNDAETIEESEKWRHLAFLRSNNKEIGVLGPLSYIKPDAGQDSSCY